MGFSILRSRGPLRSSLSRLPSLCAGVVLTLALMSPGAAAGTTTDGVRGINVWKVSLRMVDPPAGWEGAWKGAFKQMASDPYLPDVVTALEVPDGREADVVEELRVALGVAVGTYASTHVDDGNTYCEGRGTAAKPASKDCGNTMIIFRKSRFTRICDSKLGPNNCAERWKHVYKTDGSCGSQPLYDNQLAIRLADSLDKDSAGNPRRFVVAGVHWPTGLTPSCVLDNLKRMNDRLEQAWPTRVITFLTGDFNAKPMVAPENPPQFSTANRDWRQEGRKADGTPDPAKKACWYQRLSATVGDVCSDALGRSFPYYDAVWEEGGPARLTSVDDPICTQWTKYTHDDADGTAYDPASQGTHDSCQSDNGRIDFIWVRFEDSSGTAIDVSDKAYPQSQILEAKTDRGWFLSDAGTAKLYSDHRSLSSVVLWCAPTTYRTPCS